MSRIYDDRPLQQEGVKNSRWQGKWDPPKLQGGAGILLEGVYHKKTRHVIQDSTGEKIRYCVFHIEFSNACQRRYNSQGLEIEPSFSQAKLVNTGYLNSSYKSVLKGASDLLTYDEVIKRVRSPLVDYETPSHAHSLCLWGEDDVYSSVECEYGQGVRLKTRGDSIFIESFTKLDSEQRQFSANYTGGEKAGESWTDRVMGFKQQQETREEKGGGEVEEDEWDD